MAAKDPKRHIRMDNERSPGRLSSDREQRPLSAAVAQSSEGGWVAVVHLGEGATVSKWFEHEQDAYGYEDELSKWLAERATA